MKLFIKYRAIGLTLAFVFALFNIGLPIVVASCPMMKYANSRSCMMCNDISDPGKVRLTNSIDKSCCVTKYASDRNKTEFLQASQQLLESAVAIVAVLTNVATQSAIRNPQYAIVADASPPLTFDIPILVSSLLI